MRLICSISIKTLSEENFEKNVTRFWAGIFYRNNCQNILQEENLGELQANGEKILVELEKQ